jgi:hypothetical protein
LRHSQLTTTMNVYIDQVDGGLGDAEAWDEILEGGLPRDTAGPPDTRRQPQNTDRGVSPESAY